MARTLPVATAPFRIKVDAVSMNETLSHIYNKRAVRTLGRIRKAFGLTRTDVGRLFDVSPEAVAKWERKGVPSSRLAELDRCGQLAELMQRRLRPDRLPGLVRTPAADLNQRTVLEVIAENGTQPIFDYLRRLASGVPR